MRAMAFTNDNADVTPLFVEIRPGLRKRIAAAIEALIDVLDQIDGEHDDDLEDSEPLEEDDPAEDSGDAEPSLGSLGAHSEGFHQDAWACGAQNDCEDEHDGREPPEDNEPTLGATVAVNQDHAWASPGGWLMSAAEAEPSLGWTGVGRGHPQAALPGYDDDRELEDGH